MELKFLIQVSYSCMTNVSSILTSHNRKILAENEKQYECNYWNKDECPLEKTDVITLNTSRKFYIGLSDTPFKERYNNHKRDFRNKRYEKSTGLSKCVWSLQESGIEFTIHWKILSHAKGMTKRGHCSLCLTEKLWLLRYFDDMHLIRNLNSLANVNVKEFLARSRREIEYSCSHINKIIYRRKRIQW